MRSLFVACITAFFGLAVAQEPLPRVQEVAFTAQDNRLSGLLTTPADGEAKAMVLIVHGYGTTNVVEGNQYGQLRAFFAAKGISTLVWDKPGRGKSEGSFDVNRPVEASAQDVLAAAAYARHEGFPGAERIGLWGISRAGWIAPLALAEDRGLAFWISASGVNALESFGYLLRSNWALEGYDEDRIELLYQEWLVSNQRIASGAPMSAYLEATSNLRQDPFYRKMTGDTGEPDEEGYRAFQDSWMATNPKFDEETGLLIYVENFDELLGGLSLPVLALFGEKDTSVDWRSTRALYERTLGANPDAALRIVTFPDGNHNLHRSETGGFDEMIEILNNPVFVDGYWEAMETWLAETLE